MHPRLHDPSAQVPALSSLHSSRNARAAGRRRARSCDLSPAGRSRRRSPPESGFMRQSENRPGLPYRRRRQRGGPSRAGRTGKRPITVRLLARRERRRCGQPSTGLPPPARAEAARPPSAGNAPSPVWWPLSRNSAAGISFSCSAVRTWNKELRDVTSSSWGACGRRDRSRRMGRPGPRPACHPSGCRAAPALSPEGSRWTPCVCMATVVASARRALRSSGELQSQVRRRVLRRTVDLSSLRRPRPRPPVPAWRSRRRPSAARQGLMASAA